MPSYKDYVALAARHGAFANQLLADPGVDPGWTTTVVFYTALAATNAYLAVTAKSSQWSTHFARAAVLRNDLLFKPAYGDLNFLKDLSEEARYDGVVVPLGRVHADVLPAYQVVHDQVVALLAKVKKKFPPVVIASPPAAPTPPPTATPPSSPTP